jgi:hypothetical protein
VAGSTFGAQGLRPTPDLRRPRWPATRGHGIRLVRAAPDRYGPKGKRYPTQSTAADPQPTPARHCRARRNTRCMDSPAGRLLGLRRVPVTPHRSCTPELGASCDAAVHSNISTRAAPEPLSRQETRIRHPGRTPPGSDKPQPVGSDSRRTPRHPTRGPGGRPSARWRRPRCWTPPRTAPRVGGCCSPGPRPAFGFGGTNVMGRPAGPSERETFLPQ